MRVAEFRKNLRQHLDDAAQGKTIVIERGGLRFLLVEEKAQKKRAIPTSFKQEYPADSAKAKPLEVNPKSHGPTVGAKSYKPRPLKDQKNGPK